MHVPRSPLLRLLVLFLVLGLAPGAFAAPKGVPKGKAPSVLPWEVKRAELPNGLKVLMIPMPSDGLVSYWTVVRTGSRDEVEKGVTGFAHFFEHMMFRGTDKYPGPVYDGIVSSMGADANAFTTDDLTAYHLSVTREDLPKVVDIESDRFQNLKYPEDQFKTESGAVYGEFRKGRTSPFEVLVDAVQNAAFDVHTYKHTTIGFEADIKRMPEQFEYSKSFFHRFYRPDNCVILVVGDFDPAATLELIRKSYGGWKRGYQPPAVPAEPKQTKERRLDVSFDGETLPILSIGWKSDRFRPDDPTYLAGHLAGELLFGETSPLYRKLVLEEQRLQFIETDFSWNRDPGLWWVFAMVKDPADARAVEAEIRAAIDDLARRGVDRQRLDDIRSKRRYGFLSHLTTPGAVAESLARPIALTGDVAALDVWFDTLAKVTPEDVRVAASRFFAPESSTVAVLRNKDEKAPAPAAPAIALPVPSDPNVSFRVWVKVGSQNDPSGKEGLAFLTSLMVAEAGNSRLTWDQILERLSPLAAGWDSSVDREMTVLSGVAHREVASTFAGLFTDAILSPGFRQEDFDRLRDRTRSELEKEFRFSSDEDLGKAALAGKVFEGTRYAHVDQGTVAGLDSITLDDVRKFHATWYTRANVVTAIGGSYDQAVSDRFASALARLPEGEAKGEVAVAVAPPPIEGRKVVLVEKPGESVAISFGHPIDLKRGSRDFYALWLANSWLGEHRNSISHLYQVIREARGMNYGDYSYIEAYPGGGMRDMPPQGVGRHHQLFEVWLRPVPRDRALFALRAAIREVETLVKNGLTKEQFEIQRKFLRKYSLQFAKTTAERLGYAVDDRFYGLEGEGHLARFRKAMDSLTLEEVNAAIRKYIHPEKMVIAMVASEAGKLKETLVSGQPTPIDYGNIPKSKEILDEDRTIASWPLKIDGGSVEVVPVESMFAK
jgi:zinc protease